LSGRNRLYAVTGGVNGRPARGLVFDLFTGGLTETFADSSVDGRLIRPHEVAVSDDGREIVVVDLSAPERLVRLTDSRVPEPKQRADPEFDFVSGSAAAAAASNYLVAAALLLPRGH